MILLALAFAALTGLAALLVTMVFALLGAVEDVSGTGLDGDQDAFGTHDAEPEEDNEQGP